MCYTNKVIMDQLEELKTKKEELVEETTTYDKIISTLYHDLEGEDLETKTGIDCAIRLQKALRQRRKAKYDVMQIKTLISQLEKTQKMLQSNEKDYFKDNKNYKKYIS